MPEPAAEPPSCCELCKLLLDLRVDMACLQETHTTEGRDQCRPGFNTVWRHRKSGRHFGGPTDEGGAAQPSSAKSCASRCCRTDPVHPMTPPRSGPAFGSPLEKSTKSLDIHCIYIPQIRTAESDQRVQRFSP